MVVPCNLSSLLWSGSNHLNTGFKKVQYSDESGIQVSCSQMLTVVSKSLPVFFSGRVTQLLCHVMTEKLDVERMLSHLHATTGYPA